ncbi:MAG: hypothetical protein IPP77_05255 [Bacteroidetes bacterium]|nr:hypothetical protein [Bacteroidota bacterium]
MNVLILAYDFPPLISISGQRPYGWYKYLPDSNISVTVITRHWSENCHVPIDYVQPTSQEVLRETDGKGNLIIRVPFAPNLRDRFLVKFGFERFAFVRRFLTLIYSFLQFLSLAFDPKRNIYKQAELHIKANPPDLIIATGEPFILFKYGYLLSSKYKIPWISDYRDPWTSNQGQYQRNTLQKIQNWFYKKLEEKYVSNAAFITTAAPSYVKKFLEIHPEKEMHVVYNGFDEEHFKNVEDIVPIKNKFIITYTGIIYPHQNVEMFLDGLDDFIRQEKITKDQLEVRFYGLELWADAIRRMNEYKPYLRDYISIHSKVPYADMVKKLRESHLLLLLSKLGVEWLNAKIFDYLAAQRKILLVENDQGILEQLLRETGGGFAANSSNDVLKVLRSEYRAFLDGESAAATSNDRYKTFSRKKQAQLFAELLHQKFSA